jgi:hypothetical protein
MWAAAPVTSEFKALADRLKLCRSMGQSYEACFSGRLYMSRYISISICDVQERLLEVGPGWSRVRPRAPAAGHKLESLILAQNERWRHA